jgi:hypothetical protein
LIPIECLHLYHGIFKNMWVLDLVLLWVGLAFGLTTSPPLESNTEKEDISSTREGQILWSFICGVKLITKFV